MAYCRLPDPSYSSDFLIILICAASATAATTSAGDKPLAQHAAAAGESECCRSPLFLLGGILLCQHKSACVGGFVSGVRSEEAAPDVSPWLSICVIISC